MRLQTRGAMEEIRYETCTCTSLFPKALEDETNGNGSSFLSHWSNQTVSSPGASSLSGSTNGTRVHYPYGRSICQLSRARCSAAPSDAGLQDWSITINLRTQGPYTSPQSKNTMHAKGDTNQGSHAPVKHTTDIRMHRSPVAFNRVPTAPSRQVEPLSICTGRRLSSLHGLPDPVLLGIVPYLCLPEVLALLTVTRKLNRLVRQYFAVNSHGVLSIPAFDSRSFLQYRPEKKTQTQASTSDAPARRLPGVKPIRLFFGQQRRDAHPSALRRLLRFIVPSLPIMHMEAHTNSRNGRGKGCAWVIVPSLAEAKRLMALNRRLFLDVNSDGEEVYMFAPPSAKEWLHEHAELAAASTSRPNHLPRQPMVVEVPQRGAGQARKILTESLRLQEGSDHSVSCAPVQSATTRDSVPCSSSAVSATKQKSIPLCSVVNSQLQNCTSPMTMRSQGNCATFRDLNAGYCQTRPQGTYTSTVRIGSNQHRYDPYLYNPLRAPT
ncbi:hypothetical protein TRVL_07270 [Trypanosoma vivax]|nr:hypothetical protein TRVL_07270 [Trypanosoma vivax]